jgi:hypothetical protein
MAGPEYGAEGISILRVAAQYAKGSFIVLSVEEVFKKEQEQSEQIRKIHKADVNSFMGNSFVQNLLHHRMNTDVTV